MATAAVAPSVVQQKLDAFVCLQPEFEACFQFLQDVHGQQRFVAFSIADCVYYLHARWICECKNMLLSVPRAREYNGQWSLELLRLWQEQGDTASVVAFLYKKLDMLPLGDITRQIQESSHAQKDASVIAALKRGRLVMLNRGFNLLQAMEAIFALPEEELMQAVQQACAGYGHLPAQIQQQLALLDTPLYAYLPHQALASCNMLLMNELGSRRAETADRMEGRAQKASLLKDVAPPYAEEVIRGYQEMNSVAFNNLLGKRFLNLPMQKTKGVKSY